MKIIAKRPFISSRQGMGNVPQGRILDIDNGYANMLIKSGLAEEYSEAPAFKAERQTNFHQPIGANSAESGSLSQAAQASRSQTASRSKRGARKTKIAG